MVKLNWGVWLYGLVVAVVGGGANAVISTMALSLAVPDAAVHFIKVALIVFGLNAFFAFFIYLAKHPAPEYDGTPETDRRALQSQAPPALPPAKP